MPATPDEMKKISNVISEVRHGFEAQSPSPKQHRVLGMFRRRGGNRAA
jgi:hypothetical protein